MAEERSRLGSDGVIDDAALVPYMQGQRWYGAHSRDVHGAGVVDTVSLCDDDDDVQVGEEVVLIGTQGQEEVTADELAALCDTIGYEIVCGIGPRVPRRYAT